ncbi:MAG: cation-efflux pump [Clostridia bacterium]|nr:cation-efflux pump [Clostridia bacterium]
MSSEKQKVALSSVFAAVFLTIIKIVVGVFTGSLGLLSEAAHSAMDLGAAIVTFFAVKISDKPADMDHNYGHGKIESFSALIETALLLVTCGWIIYEAVERLFLGKIVQVEAAGSVWGIGIMILSIVINVSRSRALKKAAQKYGSQALEADALHFDTDVWSSLVVIVGLVCVAIGDFFNIPWLKYGDPVAALGVSVLVIFVSIDLGKRTIDVLLDAAPKGMITNVLNEVNAVNGVLDVASVRVRPSGPNYFIDLSIGINRNESHRVVHSIVDEIKERLHNKIPNCDVMVSTFPIDIPGAEDREVFHTIKKIVDKFPICTNIHNIHVYEVAKRKFIALHLEIKESMTLKESHKLSHDISEMIQEAMCDVEEVSVNFECVKQRHIQAQDVTEEKEALISEIDKMINKAPDKLNCHDIKIYSRDDKLTMFLHCELYEDYTSEKIELISKSISNKLRSNISNVADIHIHVEPMHE